MRQDLFDYIAKELYTRSGLALTQEKVYLLESRLTPIARQHGLETLEGLVAHLMQKRDEALMGEVVQAMTTNETMFFRDNKPFEWLKNIILPELKAQGAGSRLKLWSAACSTGQEPYTLAMTMQEESAKYPGVTMDITATDLCDKALGRAKEGLYTQFEVQRGMPIQLLLKYFDQREGNQWQVKDILKRDIRFSSHNLIGSPKYLGQFDIVYCRNVLIYFDQPMKKQVFEHIASVMKNPGYLVLGSAERATGICDRFVPVEGHNGLYKLK
jgi:chemotaxis protein methyltransferase CheR